MLLIATKSPFVKQLPTAPTNSVLLLTQDSVIAVNQPFDLTVFTHVYALQSDLEARGLMVTNSDIEVIDIAKFVKLTENHQPIVNW